MPLDRPRAPTMSALARTDDRDRYSRWTGYPQRLARELLNTRKVFLLAPLSLLTLGLAAALVLTACGEVEAPPKLRLLELKGTPRERGLQHGRALSSEIKSFYTTMLGTSLLPYLNREQPDISAFLKSYDGKDHPEYANGQFSYRLLLESALELEKSIPADLVEEMKGVAEGAQVPYEHVLLLNTFVDSVLGARAVTLYLRQTQSPVITWLEVQGPPGAASETTLAADGVDNDGDGLTDEKLEQRLNYAAQPTASLVEVPVNSKFRFLITDSSGLDPNSVRVQLAVAGKSRVFKSGAPQLEIKPFILGNGQPSPEDLEVILTPPELLPAASVVTLGFQASDAKLVLEPPPAKARTMRLEQITLTTQGHGKPGYLVRNLGVSDGTTQPPSMAFALRGSATADGKPLLGHHFSLLDAGTSHKHCVLQLHRPTSGPAFAMVGWAGIIYGFSGLSARGVAIGVTHADTLNNPLIAQVQQNLLAAKLLSSGLPIGLAARTVLEQATSAKHAEQLLLAVKHTFGWNVLLADAAGDIRALELTSGVDDDQAKPIGYGPEAKDARGQPLSSVGPDDLLTSVHFRALQEDMDMAVLVFALPPQRHWTSYYYSSLRTFSALGDAIHSAYGQWTSAKAREVLSTPALVDPHDSMQAAVLEPASRRLWIAAGAVPAASAGFVEVVLPKWEGP